jgi:hypothetical protein
MFMNTLRSRNICELVILTKVYIYRLESAKKGSSMGVVVVGIKSRFGKSKVKSRFACTPMRSTSTRARRIGVGFVGWINVERTRVGLGYSNIRGIGWQASGKWHIS